MILQPGLNEGTKQDLQVSKVQFQATSFWIRVYDIPFHATNILVGRLIGASIREVEEVDAEEGRATWGEYVRLRVKLDISKPLIRGKKVNPGNLGTYWLRFIHERLPNFCYACGKLGIGTENALNGNRKKKTQQRGDFVWTVDACRRIYGKMVVKEGDDTEERHRSISGARKTCQESTHDSGSSSGKRK